MKKVILAMVLFAVVCGCTAAVREGRPEGANFSETDYYRMKAKAAEADAEPVDLVNPLMGTDSVVTYSHGNTYPAVALPWGMNFWSPQTGSACGCAAD